MTLGKRAFETIVEKGENPAKQHFYLFFTCFPSYQRTKVHLFQAINSSFADILNLKESKICCMVRGSAPFAKLGLLITAVSVCNSKNTFSFAFDFSIVT